MYTHNDKQQPIQILLFSCIDIHGAGGKSSLSNKILGLVTFVCVRRRIECTQRACIIIGRLFLENL